MSQPPSPPRRRALVLSQTLPAHTGLGAAMRLGNWVQALATEYAVDLLVVSADAQTTAASIGAEWHALCASITVVNVADEAGPSRNLWHDWLGRSPLMWRRWPWRAVQRALPHGTHSPYAAVLVFRLRLWPVWLLLQRLGARAQRVVLDLDDVESAAQARQLALLGRPHFGRLGSLLALLEVQRLAWAEARVCRRADAVTLASDTDAQALALRTHSHRVHVVPNAVTMPELLPPAEAQAPFTVLFIGALDYSPNADAVRWLADELLPLMQARWAVGRPWRCLVVGRRAPAWMLGIKGLEVHSDVPEVRPYFARSHALLVPMRMGGGTRIKIIEALGMGRPVVSTPVGAEGLGLSEGTHLLLGETAMALVQALERVRDDEAATARLVAAGRAFAMQHLSQQAAAAAALRVAGGATGLGGSAQV
jgi:glycosyltransferase involved in cell wall biosynthesis